MKHSLLIFFLLTSFTLSQNEFERFNTFISASNFDSAKAVLNFWTEPKEKDPQYFICQFNYYVTLSQKSQKNLIADSQAINNSIAISDPSTNKTIAYLKESAFFSKDEYEDAVHYINRGILLFPRHFEMRFGLMHYYRLTSKWDAYLTALKAMFEFLELKKPKQIFWNNNETQTNPKEFTIEIVQSAFSEIMHEHGFVKLKKFFHKLADVQIKYYPNNKYGYSNKGALYYNSKEDKESLKYFKKAAKIDPKDFLIQFNIALVYKELGKVKKAKEQFEKILNSNSDFKEYAKHQLNILNKSN